MPEPAPITVYLDTQDYSRFGDVIRGASIECADTFARLKELRENGQAKFVYSMPIVSELLQFDSQYEETCIAKAQAIEILCRGNALIFPGRLVEDQAAAFAKAKGILPQTNRLECVRSDNEWYPRITSALSSFKDQFREQLDDTIRELGPLPRHVRRRLKRQTTNAKIIVAARAAMPELALKYQLPVSAVEHSIIPLIADKLSVEEATRRLFGAIAQPTSFIHVYFKAYDGDKTAIPRWMSCTGESLQASFQRFRDQASPLMTSADHANYLKKIVARDISRLGTALLRLIDTEEAELGITDSIREMIGSHPDSAHEIPVCKLMHTLLLGYIEQTVAVVGAGAKIEHSFGGDLVHSLYIDCVDIWRGDRRFSELIRQKFPERRSKLEPSLAALPDHITRLYRERANA